MCKNQNLVLLSFKTLFMNLILPISINNNIINHNNSNNSSNNNKHINNRQIENPLPFNLHSIKTNMLKYR